MKHKISFVILIAVSVLLVSQDYGYIDSNNGYGNLKLVARIPEMSYEKGIVDKRGDIKSLEKLIVLPYMDALGRIRYLNKSGEAYAFSTVTGKTEKLVSIPSKHTSGCLISFLPLETNKIGCYYINGGLIINRIGMKDTYIDVKVQKVGELIGGIDVIFAQENLFVLYMENETGIGEDTYLGFYVFENGSYKILKFDELLPAMKKYDSGVFYSNGLFDGSGIISIRKSYEHRFNNVRIPDISEEQSGSCEAELFDAEGNIWLVKWNEYSEPDDMHDPNSYAFQAYQAGMSLGYTLHAKPDNLFVFYAGRTYGYEGEDYHAEVTDSGLRVRTQPTTSAMILANLKKGDKVQVIATGPKETINGVTAHWLRIIAPDGMVGWAFGGFLR